MLKSRLVLIGGVVFLVLAGTGLFLFLKTKPATNIEPLDVSAIRKIFAPEQNGPGVLGEQTPMPPVKLPVPALPTPTPVVSEVPALSSITPRGSTAAIPRIADAVLAFRSEVLGFETETPAEWQMSEQANSYSVVFVNQTGLTYSIQSLRSNGETMETIKIQLLGSPSVSNIQSTVFHGEPAIMFDVAGQFRKGLTVIHAGKIFYIMGPDITGGPLEKFIFI